MVPGGILSPLIENSNCLLRGTIKGSLEDEREGIREVSRRTADSLHNQYLIVHRRAGPNRSVAKNNRRNHSDLLRRELRSPWR